MRSTAHHTIFAAALLAAVAALGAAACKNTTTIFGQGAGGGGQAPGGMGGAGGAGGSGAAGGAVTVTDKVDILLVIDNSRSMADKQQILGYAVPALLDSFINPSCVDSEGIPADQQPSQPSEPCPAGYGRQVPPQRNLHLGVITSSLGGHGADTCDPDLEPTNDDHAHLITRTVDGGTVETYEGLGFLAWDPDAQLDPPGSSNAAGLTEDLVDMVLGAGQHGCGFEAQLESWYRFLVEPTPYQSIRLEGDQAELVGTDNELLQQRRAFLRPDSALAIIVLTDENDCSIRDGGIYWIAAQAQVGGGYFHLPRPTAECEVDPNDICCYSCGQINPPPGCLTSDDDCSSPLSPSEDHINLRCFDQKRRFGIDFLYPIDRYVAGLTQPEVQNRHGEVVPNPIFTDLDTGDGIDPVRSPSLVFVEAIVGVPWQDIARQDGSGDPDLVSGLDALGRAVGAFQSPDELVANQTWDIILGNPAEYHTDPSARPTDPLVWESIEPREGANPVTGDPLMPPESDTMANPINGHEYDIPGNGDLQYSCIFELPEPRDCTEPEQVACECDPGNANPLCQDADNDYGTTQFRAKAYPPVRHLELLRGLNEAGAHGLVGSICPAQLDDEAELDYGYVPAIRTLMAEIQPHLGES